MKLFQPHLINMLEYIFKILNNHLEKTNQKIFYVLTPKT